MAEAARREHVETHDTNLGWGERIRDRDAHERARGLKDLGIYQRQLLVVLQGVEEGVILHILLLALAVRHGLSALPTERGLLRECMRE